MEQAEIIRQSHARDVRGLIQNKRVELDDDRFRGRAVCVEVREVAELEEHVCTASIDVAIGRGVIGNLHVGKINSRRAADACQRSDDAVAGERTNQTNLGVPGELQSCRDQILKLHIIERASRDVNDEAVTYGFTHSDAAARCASFARADDGFLERENRLLAEVVIRTVHTARERDAGEYIIASSAGTRRALCINAVRVASGRSRLGNRVRTGPQRGEGICTCRIRRERDTHRNTEVVRAGKRNARTDDAALDGVLCAVIVVVRVNETAE